MKDIRGHICEGLRKYQENGGGCVPDFTKEGYTRGCDDTNGIPIVYCPFCGEKLSPVFIYTLKCKRCGHLQEQYEYNEAFNGCDECCCVHLEVVSKKEL